MPLRESPERKMPYKKEVVLNIILLFLFVLLTVSVLLKQTLLFDQSLSTLVYSLRIPFLTTIMSTISNLGDIYTGAVIALLTTFLLITKKHKKDAFVFSLSMIIVGLINYILKLVFVIPRPNISPLTALYDFSYPSGHAMNNIFLYGMIVYYISRYGKSRLIKLFSLIVSTVWITLIGISRIYLGVHYPTDVLAGYLLGLWSLTTVLILYPKLSKRS